MSLTAYDKIDELIKVAADFPIKQIDEIELTDELLYIDQLPQLLKLFRGRRIKWNLRSKIVGPDGTVVEVEGSEIQKEPMLIGTPIKRVPLGWFIPKIRDEEFKQLVHDLIPCKEGESNLNPSMWQRLEVERRGEGGDKYLVYKLAPGEISESLSILREREKNEITSFHEGSIILNTNMYNPTFYYLNPFFINSTQDLEIGRSNFFCLSLDTTVSIISDNPFIMNFKHGIFRAEGSKFLVLKTRSWKESKPHLISWDLRNPVIRVDCKPPFKISLYKIEPPWALPFYISYINGRLRLGLVNLSEDDMIFTFSIAGRISYAKVLGADGSEIESLNAEFDRVKIPIRRFGILFIEIGVRRLLENFLRRKMID